MSTVAPALLQQCYAFFEVGPKFIHHTTRPKLMEVSPDGIFMCTNGGPACPNYHIHGERKILVEIKSPFPSDEVPENVYYDVPVRHVPQLLAEMKAYECSELWLVCSMKRSCSINRVHFDEHLWESLWSLVSEHYADEKPKMPTRLHAQLQHLRLEIVNFTKTKCQLVCEVPTVTGDYGDIYIDPNFASPFAPTNLRNYIEPNIENIQESSHLLAIESKATFNACHEVLRTPAKELLVFMLTNKDRKQDKTVPYSYPIAYAMKGPSMSNEDLKFMVRKLRNILQQHNIPVLCEAYDGQWHNHITQTENGEHLTKFFGRSNWLRISKLSKDKCMEQLAKYSIVKFSNRKEIEKLQRGFKSFANENIALEQNNVGGLLVSTTKSLMCQVVSVTLKSRPDLFHEGVSVFSQQYKKMHNLNAAINFDATVGPLKKCKKQIVGLQVGEKDIRHLLVPEKVNTDDQEDLNPEHLPDLDTQPTTLEDILNAPECPLLPNILKQLQNFNESKWQNITVSCIFPHMLSDANELNKMCIGKELAIIAMELRCLTGRIWYSSSSVKAENVNTIVSAFGGKKIEITNTNRRKERVYQPETLVNLSSQIIKSDRFPVEHIQAPLATVVQRQSSYEWYAKCTVQLNVPIPPCDNNRRQEYVELFAYLEFSNERKELEPRTFDFTHILTNIRCQILTRGFDYCRKEHFEELCKENPEILSIALVFDKIDTQNAFTAMRMFNYSVECWMQKKGYAETAEFIRLIRNWHDACNRRGLSTDTRVHYLTNMHSFLVKGINFNCMPFQFPERYIRGMTWQTYEVLLQSISTRIQLYYLSANLTYNAHAVSTLSNESFFSDLVRYDKESHGYPKGVNVCKVFGCVVLINYFKHKWNKNYFLSATVKGKYEIKLAENNFRRYIRESAYHHSGLYRDHFFDFPNELNSQRVCRDDITTGLASLRTNPGVRVFFKTNEGNILPEIRGGRTVKGFTLEKNVY